MYTRTLVFISILALLQSALSQVRVPTCPSDQPQVFCAIDPCTTATCDSLPGATCYAYYCGGCNTLWSTTKNGTVTLVPCPKPVTTCAVVLCINGTQCVETPYGPSCVPITNPCATVLCLIGYECAVIDGRGVCVKPEGKPGRCPNNTATVCTAIYRPPACFSDAECPGTQKCCTVGCFQNCTEPVAPPPAKPGTCPVSFPDITATDACLLQCSSDSDCFGDAKCCPIGCSKVCSKPAGSTCDCGTLYYPLFVRRVCPDGSTSGYYCNNRTCSWEFKDCPCTCDYTAFAETASFDTTASLYKNNTTATGTISAPIPVCLSAVAEYSTATRDAITSTAINSVNAFSNSSNGTTTTIDPATASLVYCYGKGGCHYDSANNVCLPTWTCQNCFPTPLPKKCVRAGCQQEKCVAEGSLITLECALPSNETRCRDYDVCDVDASGNCAWANNLAYKKCLADPTNFTKECRADSPCQCSSNPDCFWCGFDLYTTAKPTSGVTTDAVTSPPIIVETGVCLPVSQVKQCYAPKTLGGFGGSIYDRCVVNTVTKPPSTFVQQTLEKDPYTITTDVNLKISTDPAVADIKVFVPYTLPPVDNGKDGIATTVVKLSTKPTATQLTKICDYLSAVILPRDFVMKNCTLDEIWVWADFGSGTTVKKRQTVSDGESYYNQIYASPPNTTTTGSNTTTSAGPSTTTTGAGSSTTTTGAGSSTTTTSAGSLPMWSTVMIVVVGIILLL